MPMGPKGMVKPDDAELADATVDALWEFLAAGSAELDAAACIARLRMAPRRSMKRACCLGARYFL